MYWGKKFKNVLGEACWVSWYLLKGSWDTCKKEMKYEIDPYPGLPLCLEGVSIFSWISVGLIKAVLSFQENVAPFYIVMVGVTQLQESCR